jgi:hypothetical protein
VFPADGVALEIPPPRRVIDRLKQGLEQQVHVHYTFVQSLAAVNARRKGSYFRRDARHLTLGRRGVRCEAAVVADMGHGKCGLRRANARQRGALDRRSGARASGSRGHWDDMSERPRHPLRGSLRGKRSTIRTSRSGGDARRESSHARTNSGIGGAIRNMIIGCRYSWSRTRMRSAA